eukprot:TRINITY_DN2567_c0_g1_i3.p1 TRINITY_DN2567_c0_g1~~TRINITY_DN2567_c0_g1_i3.p1  ORF type:complete len:158 (+),score=46.52 TRINITY_DN2567_c0_g1_i3:42-515(+)
MLRIGRRFGSLSARKPVKFNNWARLYSSYPADRKYTKSHEWVKVEKGVGIVGITQHAADALGEVVYVELPEKGASVAAGESFGAVESVKAASDVYSPVSGTVEEFNEEVLSNNGLINQSPNESGWMIKVRLSDENEVSKLLSNTQYEEHLKSSEKDH